MIKLKKTFNVQTLVIPLMAIIFLDGMGFSLKSTHQTFDEITVKRINLMEDDGTLRMVLSNKTRQHPGRMDGQDFPDRERQAGLLFFNDEGDEAGGLIYGIQEAGEQKASYLSLTMDQYKNDQVVQVLNQDIIDGDKIHTVRGFMVNQFPQGSRLMPFMEKMKEAQNLEDPALRQQHMHEIQQTMGSRPVTFMGKGDEGNGLFIYDDNSVPKLLVYVDSEGVPRIQTTDKNYNLIDLITPEK